MTKGLKAGRILLLMAMAALFWALTGQAQAWAQAEYRALLIGNGNYTQLNSLGAGPQNDSLALEAALKDPRLEQPVQITRKNDLTLPAMRAALKSAFSGAGADDVSIFFYSGHGALVNGDAYLCPVDAGGLVSSMLSMDELRSALDAVPGQKIVILDSCYSGAAIARSASSPAQAFNAKAVQAFLSPETRTTMAKGGYKVITAAGGREQSYVTNWTVNGGTARLSCFSGSLAQGLGVRFSASGGFSAAPGGEIAADANRDGDVTLSELYSLLTARMREIDGLSNVQVYPRSDSTPLLRYGQTAAQNPVSSQKTSEGAVKQGQSVEFEARLESAVKSLTLNVYRRNYTGGPLNLVYSRSLGAQSAGKLSAAWDGRDSSGALCEPGVYFLSLSGLDASGRAFEAQCPMAQISLVAAPASPQASLALPVEAMAADGQNEIAIEVENLGEDYLAQRYTLTIRDEKGRILRTLARDQLASRSYEDEGDGLPITRFVDRFYWDGRDERGDLCAPGRYTVRLLAEYLGKTLTCTAQLELLSPESAQVKALGGSTALFKLNRPGARMTFSGTTNAPGALSLEIYNAKGALVTRLVRGYHPGGAFSATWDGTGLSGESVKSGSYTARACLNGGAEASFAFKVKAGAAAPSFTGLKASAYYQGGSLKYSLRLNGRGRVRAWVYSDSGELITQLPSFSANRGSRSRAWKNELAPGRYRLVIQTQNLQSGRVSKPKGVSFTVKAQPAPRLSKVRVSGRYAVDGRYTYFRFYANRAGRYTLTLYGEDGEKIGNLRTGKACTKGNHGLKLFLKKDGKPLPRGNYILGIRLESGGQVSAEKRVGIRIK